MFSTSENYWCGQRPNAPEAVDLPAGFVDDLVAGFQIVILQVAFQITLSPLESSANRALSPLLETPSQRNCHPFGIPDAFWNAYPQRKNELWAFIPKRTPGLIICYGDLQRVCRNQMTDILRRRKDHPSAALLCFDTVLISAVPDGRGRWQRLP